MQWISKDDNRKFIEFQHRFRGLVSEFRSRRFVKERRIPPHGVFRSGLQDLLLDVRASIHPRLYRDYLEWLNSQIDEQLNDLTIVPLGYDELSGIYTKASPISLDNELLWITERLRVETKRLNALVGATAIIQHAVFTGAYEEAVACISGVQDTLGVSLWSVQLRLALEQLAGGLERQKRYSAEIRKVHRTGLLNFVAYHTSVRNEDRTTYAKFVDDIDSRISGLSTHSEPTKTYDRYRLNSEYPSTDTGLADILRVEQSQGIVDIYETYIAVLQEIVKRNPAHERAELILRCLDQLEIDDFRLQRLGELLHAGRVRSAQHRVTNLSDALFADQSRTAIRLAYRTISDDPWQYIYAGFALSTAKRYAKLLPARPTNVAQLIALVQSRHEPSADSWATLTKLTLNLRGLPLGAGLLEFAKQLRRVEPSQPWRPWLVGLNSPKIGSEDVRWDAPSAPDGFADTATKRAWREAVCQTDDNSTTHRLFRALGQLSRSEFAEADNTLADISEFQPEALRNLSALALLHSLHAKGERTRVVELIADEGTRSATHAQFLPVLKTLSDFKWHDYKAAAHPLSAPIALHLLWTAAQTSDTASMMRFATGQALRKASISRPSDLEAHTLDTASHQLIYFLRYVCVPDILDLARIFKSTKAILEERQAICGLLLRLDDLNNEAYRSEIVMIANELELDEGRWIVDSARIHVDSDGLLRWALRELSEDYARYRDLVHIEIDSNQSFEDVLRELEISPVHRGAYTPDNEADAVLVH